MSAPRVDIVRVLLAFGLLAFVLAGLSIVDMFVPRPYDGVLLEADAGARLLVRQVIPGSGAERAGIRAGDIIVGIAREVLRSPSHAARQLNRHRIGETVPYLVRSPGGVQELYVELGRRRIGDPYYLYACLLGGSFFLVGVFVLLRQPRLRASQVFFLVCTLFMLFLICRLRPASYSAVDQWVLATGTAALLFLPATFLHFFLIFPRPIWRGVTAARFGMGEPPRWVVRAGIALVYLLPPLVLLAAHLGRRGGGGSLHLISGAPVANWWVLALYMLLGMAALAVNATGLSNARERRGAGLVFFGVVFGLIPFLVLAVAFPALLHTEKLLVYGVMPLVLVPVTFAYAIVRFQLLDIRVLLRKSLLYTATSAVLTAVYALAIASAGWLFRGTGAGSSYSPLLLALAIVLLFDPLRRRLQVPLDRFFFAERSGLERAAREMGRALAAQPDLAAVVSDLVERLPRLLGLHFAVLYLVRDGRLVRIAGPEAVRAELPLIAPLHHELDRQGRLSRLADLARVGLRSPEAGRLLEELGAAGVEVVGQLASPRREVGLMLLSGKSGQMAFEDEELELLRGLLHQAAIALETNLLLEERAKQAELERELEIAASIQARLLPAAVELAPGWSVAFACRPARHVGGDFIVSLPGLTSDSHALAIGDVAGKSVSGALVMMAAYEVLSTLGMTARDPEELLCLANQRLHRLGQKNFVALTYFVTTPDGESLAYALAGQPQPLKRTARGEVVELPLPEHRLPLGALAQGRYRLVEVPLAVGELALAYSDGVVEAVSPRGEFFGLARLQEVVGSSPAEPDALVARVLAAIDAFAGEHPPYDDLTLLAVSRQREVRP